jgi:hypothetical protein
VLAKEWNESGSRKQSSVQAVERSKRKEFQKKEEKIQRHVHDSELSIAIMIERDPWKLRNGDRETAEKESKSKKAREKVAKEIPKQTEKPRKKTFKKNICTIKRERRVLER